MLGMLVKSKGSPLEARVVAVSGVSFEPSELLVGGEELGKVEPLGLDRRTTLEPERLDWLESLQWEREDTVDTSRYRGR